MKNCYMRRDEGHNKADFCNPRRQKLMWFYIADRNLCARMTYGGCGGNGNRYCTEEQCYQTCNNTKLDKNVHEHYNHLLKQHIRG